MEGLSLPCSIGFKWPRMALPCQCLVFNALSELVVVAKLLTETEQITATCCSTCSTVRQHCRGRHEHGRTCMSLMSRLVN